jgi:hypothetical protein
VTLDHYGGAYGGGKTWRVAVRAAVYLKQQSSLPPERRGTACVLQSADPYNARLSKLVRDMLVRWQVTDIDELMKLLRPEAPK